MQRLVLFEDAEYSAGSHLSQLVELPAGTRLFYFRRARHAWPDGIEKRDQARIGVGVAEHDEIVRGHAMEGRLTIYVDGGHDPDAVGFGTPGGPLRTNRRGDIIRENLRRVALKYPQLQNRVQLVITCFAKLRFAAVVDAE